MIETIMRLLVSAGSVVVLVGVLWLVLTRTVLGRGFAVPLKR